MRKSDSLPAIVPDHSQLKAPVVFKAGRQLPGEVGYSIRRYAKPKGWSAPDAGALHYYYSGDGENSYLELRFCMLGNMYCRRHMSECSKCAGTGTGNCNERVDSVDFLNFTFTSTYLKQFADMRGGSVSDDLLSFRHTSSFARSLPVCLRTRMMLEGMLNHSFTGGLENIYLGAQVQMLLLFSLDCMDERPPDIITCTFLANEADREKINLAREILVGAIGDPITIRELSRKVAMNECYLKKGFKEMFGTTIFEFYQGQRMEYARQLLYEKGMSVTEVSAQLGYSSISHFSTAFKRHTGLKPCELLFRN